MDLHYEIDRLHKIIRQLKNEKEELNKNWRISFDNLTHRIDVLEERLGEVEK